MRQAPRERLYHRAVRLHGYATRALLRELARASRAIVAA